MARRYDERRLADLVATTADAKQRDRYRVVLVAGAGLGNGPELERERIAAAVGRSRQFVDQWVGRYRTGGVDALVPKPQPGAARRLTPEQEAQLCQMLESGPPPEAGIAAYNGPILREWIERRFGKAYSLNGVYKLLHRLGYNDLMPRPRHPDTDALCLPRRALLDRLARVGVRQLAYAAYLRAPADHGGPPRPPRRPPAAKVPASRRFAPPD